MLSWDLPKIGCAHSLKKPYMYTTHQAWVIYGRNVFLRPVKDSSTRLHRRSFSEDLALNFPSMTNLDRDRTMSISYLIVPFRLVGIIVKRLGNGSNLWHIPTSWNPRKINLNTKYFSSIQTLYICFTVSHFSHMHQFVICLHACHPNSSSIACHLCHIDLHAWA